MENLLMTNTKLEHLYVVINSCEMTRHRNFGIQSHAKVQVL